MPQQVSAGQAQTVEAWEARIEAARQSRALTMGLGGTCVAIFTFLMFFLYPRLGEVNTSLFRLTVLTILASIYLLVFAALCYFICLQNHGMDTARSRAYLVRADGCFAVAVALLVAAPAMILFTINLLDLGFVALGMWSVFLVLYLLVARDLLHPESRAPRGP